MNPATAAQIGVSILCSVFLFAVFILLVSGGPPARRFSVIYYSQSGKEIRRWEELQSVDPIWSNNRVVFVDGDKKQICLFGVMLVREHATAPPPAKVQATHTVTFYAGNGEPISAWQAVNVDPHWTNSRVKFQDGATSDWITLFGSVMIQQN